MIRSVYLDTNVFIAAFETTGSAHDHAWHLLSAAEEGRIVALTSELTLAELLSGSIGGLLTLDEGYASILTERPGLRVPPIERPVLLAAAAIRRQDRSIKLPDAIHVATAIVHRCTLFVSADQRLRSPSVEFARLGIESSAAIDAAAR